MYEREVKFEAGHDCIRYNCEFGSDVCAPGKGASHGVHGMNIRFTVSGREGSVQFLLFTGWVPNQKIHDKQNTGLMPADLGVHSKKPLYDGHEPFDYHCKFTGGKCYYDGSILNAENAFKILTCEGDDQLWKFLESYYEHEFFKKGYPDFNDFILTKRIPR